MENRRDARRSERRGSVNAFARRASAAALAASVALAAACSDALLDEREGIVRTAFEPAVSPATGTMIAAHETITIRFPSSVDGWLVVAEGSVHADPAWALRSDETAAEGLWSEDLTTLELNPENAALWESGEDRTLKVTVSRGGSSVSFEYSFEVFDGVCVEGGDPNASDDESKGWAGTQSHPFLTIPAAISFASAAYPGGCEVRVAPMTASPMEYRTDYRGDPASRIVVEPECSLLGGYSADWTGRDAASNVTVIRDESASGGDWADPNRAISAESAAVGRSTLIDGFTVHGGGGDVSAAVFCGGASPTFANMKIDAGAVGAGDVSRIGAYIAEADGSPRFAGCSINESGGGADIFYCYGVYIYSTAEGEPEFEGCSIRGGAAGTVDDTSVSCAFMSDAAGSASSLRGSSILGGDGYSTYCLFLRSSTQAIGVYNCLILPGSADFAGYNYALYVSGCEPIIRNNTIYVGNANGYCSGAYGIYLRGTIAQAKVDNNIIVCRAMTSSHPMYGIYESQSGSDAESVSSDCFHGFAEDGFRFVYRNNNSTDYATIAAMEAGLNAEAPGAASGNVAADPFLGADYRPTSSSPASVTAGGIDGAAAGWDFNDDMDGVARSGDGSAGWSIGCFEYD